MFFFKKAGSSNYIIAECITITEAIILFHATRKPVS